MPMTRDEHETLLNELLNPEIEHSRRTEILQQMRVDYTSVITDFDKNTQTIEKLTKDNGDLVVSNSKLFRQIGLTDTNKKEDEKKEISETITIEELEKGV
ncbi:MAG: scaffolding protein [Ignavibacteria bacterium]|nr:scaffolding protein [Ignavibacteria bacterium]